MNGLRSFLWLAFPSSRTSKTIIRMLTFKQQCPTTIHPSARLLPDIFFDTRPSLILKIIGYRVTWNIGYFPLFQVIPNILGLPWNSRDKYSPFFNTRPEPACYCKNIIVHICCTNINTLFISNRDSGHPPASQQLCWGWACRLEEFLTDWQGQFLLNVHPFVIV